MTTNLRLPKKCVNYVFIWRVAYSNPKIIFKNVIKQSVFFKPLIVELSELLKFINIKDSKLKRSKEPLTNKKKWENFFFKFYTKSKHKFMPLILRIIIFNIKNKYTFLYQLNWWVFQVRNESKKALGCDENIAGRRPEGKKKRKK